MLRRMNDLIGFNVRTVDDNVGHVQDFYLDSQSWDIVYMVVDTGPLFLGRKVLICPEALGRPVWDVRIMPVELSKQQVESSPDIDLHKPVSRQDISSLHRHYGWPAPWMDDELLGTTYMGDQPEIQADSQAVRSGEAHTLDEPIPERRDRYLRSVHEIVGYHIAALDGEIGHLDDLFADENGWHIQYLLVDTSNWLGGRRVLIATDWIERVGWTDSLVHINLTREKIENSPEYDPQRSPSRDYEMDLYGYYGFPGYWV